MMEMIWLLYYQLINIHLLVSVGYRCLNAILLFAYIYFIFISIEMIRYRTVLKNRYLNYVKIVFFPFVVCISLNYLFPLLLYLPFVISSYYPHFIIHFLLLILISVFIPRVSTHKDLIEDKKNVNSSVRIKILKEKLSNGDIFIGNAIITNQNRERLNKSRIVPVKLKLDDIKKHIFICGMSGFGKTTMAQIIISSLAKYDKNLNFLIIELKEEYRTDLWEDIGFIYLMPGINFSINIFDSEGESADLYAKKLFGLIKELYFDSNSSNDLTPQMVRVFSEALGMTIQKYDKSLNGWDLFLDCLEEYYFKNRNEIWQLDFTISAIKNRLFSLLNDPLKSILSDLNAQPLNNVINQRVIINPRSIYDLGGEPNELSLLLSIIFKKIWENNLRRGKTNKIVHLTVIDDAQYFIPQHKSDMSVKTVKYIEDIALIERGTGEALITIATRPIILENILSNAGIIVVFASSYDIPKLNLMLSNTENKYSLNELNVGECYLKTPGCAFPIKINIETHELKKIMKNNNKMGDKIEEVLEFGQ